MKTKTMRLLPLLLALLLLISGCGMRAERKAETPKAPAETTPAPQDAQETARVEVATVTTADFTMDYLHFGHGEKTLVILPGLAVQSVMGSAEAVAEAYAPLTDAFTIYLFERRNDLPDAYSIADMARDTAQALRVLGLEDVCLFGVSMGGMIAEEIAIEYPELVQRLVLGSACADMPDERFRVIEAWIDLAKAGDAKALYLAFGAAIYPQEVFEQSQELLAEAAESVTEADLARFVILAESMRGFDVTDRLDSISCPVLAIGSEDDAVLGADATTQIAACLRTHPDFAVYLYNSYGHAAYDLAPDYKERLLQFFAPEGER